MKTKNAVKLLPIIGLGILISCGEKKTETTSENSKIKVNTTVAKLQPVDKVSTYTATVKADVINQITPAVPGRIEKIYVEIGDKVRQGQLLVQMESSNLQQQNTQLANLEKDYERYSALLKEGGIAQQQVDQIKTQIDVLKTVIKNIQDNTQLKSPINGTVTARNYDNGDVFAQQPILTVQQLNPLKAVINVTESYFALVKQGMSVDITLDVYGSEVFTGKVSLIYPTIDATTHTFGVEVTILNSHLRVRPGMYARVSLNLGTGESIIIPDVTIQRQPGANDKFVFTIEDGIAKYHKVELGQHLGENYEILSGLNPGDVVVTAGQTRLIDGTKVEIINH
ncbi:MAG: efflux RND transporter periplasmic adaptor subunit [Dysgonamonadaceae bacterium]|jgi:RND family efflux transporter MFP subunit|nr:efflux RND transporter periplasmic adaptor subunit [Dysgonamonadaceae bacterium]